MLLMVPILLEEHLTHIHSVLKRLLDVGLKLKPGKCKFLCKEVEYLGHILTPLGLKPTQRHVEAVHDFPVPINIKGVRQFLGLESYYRHFIPQFSQLAEPLHVLTRKNVFFEWNSSCQEAFQCLKGKLTQALVLYYPDFNKDFILETDASIHGLSSILSQVQSDGKMHPIAYASRALSPTEKNYSITELETLAVVWAIGHFYCYLYGQEVTVYTDHTAVKAVLDNPTASGKHARWWSKVYQWGIRKLNIKYRPGKENSNADVLSRCPHLPAPDGDSVDSGVLIAEIQTTDSITISSLLKDKLPNSDPCQSFILEQKRDTELKPLIDYIMAGKLPEDDTDARKVILQSSLYTVIDGALYYIDPKSEGERKIVVPNHLRKTVMEQYHSGVLAGHFSGPRLFKTLSKKWWWSGIFKHACEFVKNCPQCVIVSGGGRISRPPLHPIPESRPFQIVGVDIMDLPKTAEGNKHVVVFQDYLTKWPLVYPLPDQKAHRLAKLLVEEVIPFFGVPEALLSDRSTNLLSHLMLDICELLGIQKLNTTAHHPQCDGMVERFNRTLKSMLRKHASRFGNQWDQYLSGVLWAYRNTPHESSGEKPSYLLMGIDCRTPTEAAFLPPTVREVIDVSDYREKMTISLPSARELAVETIQEAQKKYKFQYDRKCTKRSFRVGDWVLVKFPQDESGKDCKLSQPWHGPYRVIAVNESDITVVNVYHSQERQIQVHQH